MAEMLILSGIVQAGNLIAFTLMCTMLTIIFVATGRSIFPMLWGQPEQHRRRCASPGSPRCPSWASCSRWCCWACTRPRPSRAAAAGGAIDRRAVMQCARRPLLLPDARTAPLGWTTGRRLRHALAAGERW
jgi:hypothetical protein